MQIKDSVFVITGGAQGLGLCMAKALSQRGGAVALVDINKDKIDEAVEICQQAGGNARGYVANVADENSVVSLFDNVVKDFGKLNGLLNNAGITRDGLLIKAKDNEVVSKMSLAAWQSVIDVNLTGVFLCAREAAAKMVELGSEGIIINISSISRSGNFGQTNYSAAKSGVAAMAVTWAKELARYGIRAAAIAPGFMATELVANMNQTALAKLKEGIPLKRLGEAEEIAHAAITIIENDYFNGRVLELDGGLRL